MYIIPQVDGLADHQIDLSVDGRTVDGEQILSAEALAALRALPARFRYGGADGDAAAAAVAEGRLCSRAAAAEEVLAAEL